jgi:hypothetical protein
LSGTHEHLMSDQLDLAAPRQWIPVFDGCADETGMTI